MDVFVVVDDWVQEVGQVCFVELGRRPLGMKSIEAWPREFWVILHSNHQKLSPSVAGPFLDFGNKT